MSLGAEKSSQCEDSGLGRAQAAELSYLGSHEQPPCRKQGEGFCVTNL